MSLLGLPAELAHRLPTLKKLVEARDEFISEGLSFDDLVDEMRSALRDVPSPKNPPGDAEVQGELWLHESAELLSGVIVEGPCIICEGARVGPNSYLRPGTVIGAGARIGFCTEVKASIIGLASVISHWAYVGNSVLGDSVELGAGVAVATKRLDDAPVRTFTVDGEPLTSQLKKLGAWIGDGVHVGVGAKIMPGTVIGAFSTVYPQAVVCGRVGPRTAGARTPTDRLALVQLLASSHYKENELFWSRNAVFVTIIAALFALFAVLSGSDVNAPPEVFSLLAILGIIASLAWLQVSRMSKHYCNRVECDLRELVQSDGSLAAWLKTWSNARELRRPRGPRATATVKIVAMLALLVWGLLLTSTLIGPRGFWPVIGPDTEEPTRAEALNGAQEGTSEEEARSAEDF